MKNIIFCLKITVVYKFASFQVVNLYRIGMWHCKIQYHLMNALWIFEICIRAILAVFHLHYNQVSE